MRIAAVWLSRVASTARGSLPAFRGAATLLQASRLRFPSLPRPFCAHFIHADVLASPSQPQQRSPQQRSQQQQLRLPQQQSPQQLQPQSQSVQA